MILEPFHQVVKFV